jgi:magnesium-transporting ATPase (P-type)
MVTIYLKGAPEIVLPMCSTVQTSNGVAQLDEKLQDEIYKEIVKMAA